MKSPQANPIQSSTSLSSSYSKFTSKISLKSPIPFISKTLKISIKVHCSQSPNPNPNQTKTPISIIRSIPNWADAMKERGMRRNRSLYNHKQWVEHRSSLRHVRHLMSSLPSRVILSLIPLVIVFTSFAVIVTIYNSSVLLRLLPEFLPLLRVPSLPYQLTAPVLALLLVFRTEASYSRFQEGRKVWTKVISGTSDFARQVIASVRCPMDAQLKNALLQYVLALPVALKCHELYGSDIRRDLQGLLEADDIAVLLSSKHRPCCVSGFISQSIQLVNLNESKRNELESKISYFHEGIGVCDQLIGIPFPLSYTRLTSRFLVFWHFTLPIILWDDCNRIVAPATFISAASLFCIEEVGVLIEEPFPMLPLEELCNKVHDDIREAIMTEKSIQALLNAKRKCCPNEHSPTGRPNS